VYIIFTVTFTVASTSVIFAVASTSIIFKQQLVL
jgi:hypothetical protein